MKRIQLTKKQWLGNGIVLLCVVLVIGTVWALTKRPSKHWSAQSAHQTIVVGVDDTYVPMGFRNAHGQLVGFDVDLARAAFKQMGLKPKFQVIDWSMKETELRTGHIDVIWNGYTMTAERKRAVLFSKPYHEDKLVLLTMKRGSVKQIKDMAHKRLGVQTGSSSLQMYNDRPTVLKHTVKKPVVQYDSYDKALNDLQVGRLDAVLISRDYAHYYVKQEARPTDFRIVETAFPKEQYGVGMRKTDRRLQAKLNQALEQVAANGEANRIAKKYFGHSNVQ
ncbi:amino acid ABC transporter substrate-binding protein [Weissella halotolerans]|uniref:Amino acid ABC superfamily ATP binding cassette transporter, binding protein n=1 Tax=Weissella halotolerans DSM 20190 TaxID=1123500 RepID=A0A0R2FTI5_9LACO|nr:amino acid ABC transporter substrate-binding protein [Weissella halotolerans]KRN31769.1 amino acid ABC superfamily ATP binding cassette transporter, binding protein [Weissella halotolerans DSM 20190]